MLPDFQERNQWGKGKGNQVVLGVSPKMGKKLGFSPTFILQKKSMERFCSVFPLHTPPQYTARYTAFT